MSASAGGPSTGASSPTSLKRVLGLWDLIIIGIVIIQPIAPMGIFGVISNEARGHVVTTILIAMVAMLVTAVQLRENGARVSHRRIGVHLRGAGNPSSARVCDGMGDGDGLRPEPAHLHGDLQQAHAEHPAGRSVLGARHRILLECSPRSTCARSTRPRESTKSLAAGMMIVVVIFFAFAIRFLWGLHQHGAAFFAQPFYNPETFSFHGVFRGTSIAVLTYIGFDGISTLSEEAENPRRNILLATVLVCVITGVLSSLEVYAAQLVWGPKPFPQEMVESAFPLVARQAGGFFLFHLLNFTILIANVGSGMGAQLAAARLLYGMGRSDALPRGFFGAIEPKRRIPMNNVVLVGAIALIGAFLISYERGVELLNFGAFIAFMGVNAAAFVRYFWRAAEKRWTNFVFPLLGFVICFFIWLHLSRPAKIAGVLWIVVGIVYGAVKTRGFQADLVRFETPGDEK